MPMSGNSIITLNATAVRLRWRAADPLLAGLLVQLHTLAETVTVSTSPVPHRRLSCLTTTDPNFCEITLMHVLITRHVPSIEKILGFGILG